MTSYVVLKKHVVAANSGSGTPPGWQEMGPPVEAVSSEAAIRKTVKEDGGTYVAVPVRFWAPIKVAVTTKRVFTLS